MNLNDLTIETIDNFPDFKEHLTLFQDESSILLNNEILFFVLIGHVNAGKSSLTKELSGKQTKITLNGNYNLPEIDYYWNDNLPSLIYADTAGFLTGSTAFNTNIKTDMENFIDDLSQSVKKNFLLLRSDLNENTAFNYVYIFLESNGNLNKQYIFAIDYIEKKLKKNWFLLISKIDVRLAVFRENEAKKSEFLNKRRNEILMQLRSINRDLLKTRLFFISTKLNYLNSAWNQLSEFKLRLEFCLNYEEQYLNRELDIDINIGVFGAGNIGKSSLIKLITGCNEIRIGDGPTTKEIKCYDHPEYWIVHFFDTPGDDGLDVAVDMDNCTHAFDVIFLLINDSITESDLKLVDDIKSNNENNERKIRLFVLKTFFDADFLNDEDIAYARISHRISHLTQLGLPFDTPFYCVSLNADFLHYNFNSDLNQFLNDWFEFGLSELQKLDCLRVSYKTVVNETVLNDIRLEMSCNIKKLMAGSFLWNLIPVFGTLVDRAYIKKFIRRYIILLKLHHASSGDDDAIKAHYEKIKALKKDEQLFEIEGLERKYLNLDEACGFVYEQALSNFAQKHPAFKSFTKIFRYDNPISLSVRTCAEIGVKTITSFVLALLDDLAREIPKFLPGFGFIGLAGVGLSIAFCVTAMFHIYLLAREIPRILVDDARAVYILDQSLNN